MKSLKNKVNRDLRPVRRLAIDMRVNESTFMRYVKQHKINSSDILRQSAD